MYKPMLFILIMGIIFFKRKIIIAVVFKPWRCMKFYYVPHLPRRCSKLKNHAGDCGHSHDRYCFPTEWAKD